MNVDQTAKVMPRFSRLKGVCRKLECTLLSLKKNYYLAQYRNRNNFEVPILDRKIRLSIEDPYSKNWIVERFAGGKIHERPVTLMILDALKDAKCFVDCGANLGWYTCLAGEFIPDGLVYGFEMDDLNFNLLRKNVAVNNFSHVMLYHVALSDAPGLVSYRRNEMGPNPGNSLSSSLTNRGVSDVITVDAISLDTFFADKAVTPDLVKIDVEGAETKVLRGMADLLQNPRIKLFVEIHPRALKELQSSVDEVLSILMENGFDVFIIEQMRKQSEARLRKLSQLSPLLSSKDQTMLFAYKSPHHEKNERLLVTERCFPIVP
ncbi:MAG: FkbM family methyltransferase [Ktedonobacteraceae bacterium]